MRVGAIRLVYMFLHSPSRSIDQIYRILEFVLC